MGKTAENERIKLTAAYYNNLSVGITIAGFILPYLAIFQKIPDVVFAFSARGGEVTDLDLHKVFVSLAALAFALWIAKTFRKWADEAIQKISE